MRFQKQILGAEEKYPFEAFVCEVLNIARIAKAALHNCPGKSSLNVNPVRPSVPHSRFFVVWRLSTAKQCQITDLLTLRSLEVTSYLELAQTQNRALHLRLAAFSQFVHFHYF